MIQRTIVSTVPQPNRLPNARQGALSPVFAPAAARPTTPAVKPAAKPVPPLQPAVSRLAAPPESLWYRLKKLIIDFFSNLDYAKPEVRGVTPAMAREVLPQLQPGDILLRRTEGTSGNWFIPSWWKHAGVYVGEGHVVDAAFKGTAKNSLEGFMTEGDSLMIVRPKGLTPQQREAIAAYAERQVGKPYDFDFDFDDEARLSCTELASHALRAGAGKNLVEPNLLGAVTGDHFKNSNFELVWTNAPERATF